MNVHASKQAPVHVHIVLDNAGFELITDLCLAEFLTETGLAQVVHFHGKPMPWFVSDVTASDWDWTLKKMCKSSDSVLVNLATKWKQHLSNSKWTFQAHDFWCSPYDFAQMQSVSPDLFAQLAQADLVFFKGDLNFRKLVGDLKWDFSTPFKVTLRGFHPTALCALRTLKCDLAVGLHEDQVEAGKKTSEDWMLNGSHGVIHFCGLQE